MTPSPVMATTSPRACSARTVPSFCSAVTRPRHERSRSTCSIGPVSASQVDRIGPDADADIFCQRRGCPGPSPVTRTTWIPASRHACTVARDDCLGGSCKATRPRRVSPCSHAADSLLPQPEASAWPQPGLVRRPAPACRCASAPATSSESVIASTSSTKQRVGCSLADDQRATAVRAVHRRHPAAFAVERHLGETRPRSHFTDPPDPP